MQFGFSPTQSRATFDAMQNQARLAETLGFETLWAHEHHSQAMMYPNPLLTVAALAVVTERMALGTNMLLLPLHHPVRVAQEAAMVDVLSNGRLRLGVAKGYSPADLRTFGVSRSQRARRMTEGVELIRTLWEGNETTRAGDGFDLEGFRLFPLPIQKPGPPMYLGGQAPEAIRRAARLGDGYVISTTEPMDQVAERVASYRAALDAAGKPWRAPLLNRLVCTVPNRGEKIDAERRYARALLALYDAWGHDNVTHLPAEERTTERIARTHLIVGEPTECVERIQEYSELGIGHIACLMNFGNPPLDLVERSMRLFGERVIPRLAA
jgi:probable F420-dependent oxidoreductase